MSVTAFGDQYAVGGDGVSADVLVVGDGIIGLSVAAELGRRGAKVTVLGREQQGAASWASGGLLAPSTGPLPDAVRPFFMESLRAYPAFVAGLSEFDADLRVVTGLIELLADEPDEARAMGREELALLEPGLPWRPNAVWHPLDGAVDARRLVTALRQAATASPLIRIRSDLAARGLDLPGSQPAVVTSTGARLSAGVVVLAAGAWSGQLSGLPRPLPVAPLKGQMIALSGCPLRHPVLAGHTYLVPRGGVTIVGSTSEDVGFDWSTDDATVASLAKVAGGVTPNLAGARLVDRWAGVRPMTPDRMPIIGKDSDVPGLVYACGHSRNGILLAPATAEAVSDIVTQTVSRHNLGPFAPGRFPAPEHQLF